MRRVDLINWALQTSSKYTTGVKYQFHLDFWPNQRSGNPNHPSLTHNNIGLSISYYFLSFHYGGGPKEIGISGSLILSKTQMELIFISCGEFRWSPEGSVSQIHSPHLLAGAPGIFSDLLMSAQMLKREWGAESNGKLLHLFIPSKTSTVVPDFVVEDLALGRTAVLIPEFAVKNLSLGRSHWWWIYTCKGRSFTASSGTKAAVLPKAGLSPKQEQRLQFYHGWIDAVASHCFPHPTLSLTSEQIFKDPKRSQWHQRGREESGFG